MKKAFLKVAAVLTWPLFAVEPVTIILITTVAITRVIQKKIRER